MTSDFSKLTTSWRVDLLLHLVLTGILVALWMIAVDRDGSYIQAPSYDISGFHAKSLQLKHDIESGGLGGLWRFWGESPSAHAPFVPLCSALLMFIFGESRAAAESILGISMFLFHFATFAWIQKIYNRGTAWASVLLLATFPICISYSRSFLFEYPSAAFCAVAAWGFVSSNVFGKWPGTLTFGAFAGIVSICRTGAPVYFVGVGAASIVAILYQPNRPARFLKLAAASLLAMAIAATWYIPNFSALFNYIFGYTFGEKALYYAGSSTSFTWENLSYYLLSILLEGPSLPVVFLAFLGMAVCLATSRGQGYFSRSYFSRAGWFLFSVFAIDFCMLLVGSQRVGARYFIPIIPIVALWVVRSVALAKPRILRIASAAIITIVGLFAMIEMTFLFPVSANNFGYGIFQISNVPFWLHHPPNYLLMNFAGLSNPRADLKIPALMTQLQSLQLPAGSNIFIISDHPYFQSGAFQYESNRRRAGLNFLTCPRLNEKARPSWAGEIVSAIEQSRAAVIRSGPQNTFEPGDYSADLSNISNQTTKQFVPAGEPMQLEDKTTARVYRVVNK
ncbi:MAG: ArnT family glycosyltransferase [Planctomycetota bacterium]